MFVDWMTGLLVKDLGGGEDASAMTPEEESEYLASLPFVEEG